jgi:hypothetical protein
VPRLRAVDDMVRVLVAGLAGAVVVTVFAVAGAVALTPADPLDARIAAAFDAHQRRDGLLGPDAVAAVVGAARGEVVVRPSPWRLGAADTELTCEWLRGWVGAACEQDPSLDAGAYLDRRLAHAASGELAVIVEHADVLVLP